MSPELLKKLAQDAFETAKGALEKAATAIGGATTSAVEGVRSVAPDMFDSAVNTVTEAASAVAGQATEAADALRETQIGRSIVEGADTFAEDATSAGDRIGPAAQGANEAFNAEEPAKPEMAPEANTAHSANVRSLDQVVASGSARS
jgi:hypothetical protein